ncbi:hypothetical protein V474_03130 [Novosphingobium barchaimii LL02]|uniref:3-alpha-hydroxysteroid dehydrogenase n=1 Tax=Novosphingobium barchaimii LL02 TaxID=1114963 RepID=A0A0J7XJ83_9SPHN|nr:coniferyl-alcohol dehydrogenase [Novosphingobium barchaimii]KMS52061.1 hypothetical protein V474_03130 [Novosphingobium barchaimii LL02]
MKQQDWLGYHGKQVIVVGCHSGIGKATAQALAELGAHVHGMDWQPCDTDMARFTHVDLRSKESIEAAVREVEGSYSSLFNCAGIAPGRPPLDVVKVNFLGTRYLTAGIAPAIEAGGSIVNVASTGGMAWLERSAALGELMGHEDFDDALAWCDEHASLVAEGYRFSKEAAIYWTLFEASRYIKRGIRMNCTLPGAVATPMLEEIEKITPTDVIDRVAQPIGRRSAAVEQAAVLLFLNSIQASYVNGAVVAVDGGFTGCGLLAQRAKAPVG